MVREKDRGSNVYNISFVEIRKVELHWNSFPIELYIQDCNTDKQKQDNPTFVQHLWQSFNLHDDSS